MEAIPGIGKAVIGKFSEVCPAWWHGPCFDPRARRRNTPGDRVTYALAFLGGVAGSIHCVGMCGGFALAAAGHASGRLGGPLLYNLGRLSSLAFVGALVGLLGTGVIARGPGQLFARGLALGAGAIMIVIALETLGMVRPVSARWSRPLQTALAQVLGGAIRSGSPLALLALGTLNAFLPCQLVYAFAAQAATAGSVPAATATMLAFGLGTVPALLAVTSLRDLARRGLGRRVWQAAGWLVLAFGLVTVARGLGPAAYVCPGH